MSLYNDVRPQNLTEVRGQEKIVAQIRAILETGNVPNVSLFVGPRGTGKTTVARIFARAINCESPSEAGPCNICKSCTEIYYDQSLDVIELDAASNNKVDDVHQIIESSRYTPLGKYKVYIVDEVHMLSTAAFNALLKLLEEPPAHCRFVLCTTEEHKVPVTILSRCRKFYFERISTAIVAEKMKDICASRDIAYEEEALRLIAKKSEGCMRDAESLLEIFLDASNVSLEMVSDILGTTSEETVWNLLHAISVGNLVTSLDIIKEVTNRGKNLQVFVRSLIEALTDLVYFHQSKDLSLIDNTSFYKEKLSEVANSLSSNRALEIASELSEVFLNVLKGGDIGFLLETKLLTLVETQSEIHELKQKLDCLEEALFSGAVVIATPVSEQEHVEKINVKETTFVPTDAANDEPPVEWPTEEIIPTVSKEAEESGAEKEIPVSNETAMDDSILPNVSHHIEMGSVLPGDYFVPEGTEVKGTVSLFDDEDLPIQIDGFRNISDDEEIPWNKEDANKNPISTKKEEEEKVEEETTKEQDPLSSFTSNSNVFGIPTFQSFFNF